MSKFPSCFPKNFESEILPSGAQFQEVKVFRIIKYGMINREAFLSTYEETVRRLRPKGKKDNPNDPGYYSTSCNAKIEDAEYVLQIMMRHYPKPFIAKGKIEPSCGPSQKTSDRTGEPNSHWDWWVYEDSHPEIFFEKNEDKNEG